MYQQLKHLADIIENIDSDPQRSMLFYTTSVTTTNVKNKPPDGVRWHLIVDTLYQIESMSKFHRDYRDIDIHLRDDISRSVDNILEQLNNKYHNHQYLCWQSHSHHFHVTVQEYINCPVTCLFEVSEFINKLIKEIYHQ